MTSIERSALLPHPAAAVYQLVNEVDAYPRYMDGCVAAEILEQGETFMVARLTLSKAGLRHSFTTRNTLVPGQSIEMALVDGPFRQFQGHWQFQPLGDGACKATLTLQFEFSNRLLQKAAGKLFQGVGDSLVDALIKRAREYYGN